MQLATLTNLSYNLVESEHREYKSGKIDLATARSEARNALKKVNVGETGYIYAISSKGDLKVHVAREGENVYNEKDENGRYFIRAQYCAQTLEQMRAGSPLTLQRPPLKQEFPFPGCRSQNGKPICEWSDFKHVLQGAIEPGFTSFR